MTHLLENCERIGLLCRQQMNQFLFHLNEVKEGLWCKEAKAMVPICYLEVLQEWKKLAGNVFLALYNSLLCHTLSKAWAMSRKTLVQYIIIEMQCLL